MLATRKAPGGKLLRLRADLHDGKLVKPQLSGDFFLMPSEKLADLERAMDGLAVSGLAEKIVKIIEQQHIELAGIAPEDIELAARELK